MSEATGCACEECTRYDGVPWESSGPIPTGRNDFKANCMQQALLDKTARKMGPKHDKVGCVEGHKNPNWVERRREVRQ